MASKQKILIVDDDNNIAELISLYLTKECYDTKIVNDGEEAVREFHSFQPNLILLDLMLPGMDGYQVCREIRHDSDVPIIMLSAKGEVFDKVLGLATDIVEVRFLAKSQVSAAIKNLEARGCLRREYQLENRKTAHLRLCDPAQPMIAAGRSAQEQFGAALLDGFTPEELEHMQRSMERIRKNVEKYLEDKNNDNVD